MRSHQLQPDSERFAFEDAGSDFPFYSGYPVRISSAQWGLILAFLAVGFAALIALPVASDSMAKFLPALLFVALPLAGLAVCVRRHWTALMHGVGLREILWMLGFGVLNIVVSLIIGGLLSLLFEFTPHRLATGLAHMTSRELESTLLMTLPQLLGEELLTILPFLALLHLGQAKWGLGRNKSVIIAWIVSALIFGAAHLSTYDWNLIQCFGIIGVARLILTLAYIKTKNIWVSFGAHVTTDWSYFTTSVLLAHAAWTTCTRKVILC